jgi:hypothetical protein
MHDEAMKTGYHRRKEVILLACSALVCALVVVSSLTGWLEEELWGDPITLQPIATETAPGAVGPPDFAAAWSRGGRNPFGDAAESLDSGGRANLPMPPLPPLIPERPPAPMPRPIDFLRESAP